MFSATQNEIDYVTAYLAAEAPDLRVEFLQKVHVENIHGHLHDVWDVHTNKDRWWVITNPTNLYSQEQFPNMDYAVTFHVGLCIRIPRSEQQKLSDLPIEPFTACYRLGADAHDALTSAEEVADYQGIGVRCREMLLTFADAAQTVLPWKSSTEEKPKRADFKAWVDHVCIVTMSGAAHEHRRHLFKALLDSAWKFSNWLTHAKHSRWHDAEAALSATESALSLCISAVLRHLRGVPEACPVCGSHRLSPQRVYNEEFPEVEWERPTCDKCDWVGEPVRIDPIPKTQPSRERSASEGECIVPKVPLRILKKPAD